RDRADGNPVPEPAASLYAAAHRNGSNRARTQGLAGVRGRAAGPAPAASRLRLPRPLPRRRRPLRSGEARPAGVGRTARRGLPPPGRVGVVTKPVMEMRDSLE